MYLSESARRAAEMETHPGHLLVELDAEGTAIDLPAMVATWLDSMMRAMIPDVFDEYLNGLHKPGDLDGGPDTSAVTLAVFRPGRAIRRNWSAKNLAWLAAQAENEETVGTVIHRPGPTFHAYQDFFGDAVVNRLQSGMVQFAFRMMGDWFADQGLPAQERLIEALVEAANLADPVYGSIGWQPDGPDTMLEEGHRHYWDYDPPGPRGLLRGYDWVTLLPKELAAKIDWEGNRSAFTSVTPLTSGAVLTRACDNFFDYDLARARELVRAFAPVLPRGIPDTYEQHGVPTPVPPLVYEDPATYLTE